MTFSSLPLRRLFGQGLFIFAAGALCACATPAEAQTPPETPPVRLESVVSGLEPSTAVVNAGDGSGRLFLTEQTGRIRILEDAQLLPEPFLNLSSSLSAGGEQGLLGLAFHPQYADNGRLFVNYTDLQGNTVVAEYHVSDDPNVADPGSARVLLTIEQPYSNHNGGNLVFGPDGYLYIGTGDGGSGGDPEGNGQDLGALLGKMLRIDVDTGDPYGVPADNPFVDTTGAQPEIWAYGLRNPWRYSFDRATGDLWIADVGQNSFEEVNRQPADSLGGENYGWNTMEASSCYSDEGALSDCDTSGLVLPVTEYGRDEGTSVTGGYVYRGEAIPELVGSYVFGDFGSGAIWHVVPGDTGGYTRNTLLETGLSIVAFGEDEAGELYMVDYSGTVHRFVADGN